MIKNLKYRLMCLKENKIGIMAAFLSIILAFEIYSCYSLRYFKEKEYTQIQEPSDEQPELELKDVVNELTSKNLDILSVEKVEDSYNIEVSIKGKKEDISNSLKSLRNYKIIDYDFNVECDNVEGRVRLSYN